MNTSVLAPITPEHHSLRTAALTESPDCVFEEKRAIRRCPEHRQNECGNHAVPSTKGDACSLAPARTSPAQ
jgi:hypothetical protein